MRPASIFSEVIEYSNARVKIPSSATKGVLRWNKILDCTRSLLSYQFSQDSKKSGIITFESMRYDSKIIRAINWLSYGLGLQRSHLVLQTETHIDIALTEAPLWAMLGIGDLGVHCHALCSLLICIIGFKRQAMCHWVWMKISFFDVSLCARYWSTIRSGRMTIFLIGAQRPWGSKSSSRSE